MQTAFGQAVSRQRFRGYFQPSRVLIGIVPAPNQTGYNPITLCFSMWTSYKPRMLAIAVQGCNYSYELFSGATEYVLAVPGASLAAEAMAFGVESGRSADKLLKSGLELVGSQSVAVPTLARAVASLEMVKSSQLQTGDHLLIVGQVRKMAVRKGASEPSLLSVGPGSEGYRVLAQHGQHRLAVAGADTEHWPSKWLA